MEQPMNTMVIGVLFMVQELLAEIIGIINSNDDIKLEEMPEYKLYISQLEEFFDKKLGKGINEDEERKAISKTMIQNYIKDGLLMPPDGKSYNTNHVILLTMIYSLKSILSIKDIKRLLTPILMDIDNESNSIHIESLYENYLTFKADTMDNMNLLMTKRLYKIFDQLDLDGWPEEDREMLCMMVFIFILIAEANTYKQIAESLIEKYFNLEEQDKP